MGGPEVGPQHKTGRREREQEEGEGKERKKGRRGGREGAVMNGVPVHKISIFDVLSLVLFMFHFPILLNNSAYFFQESQVCFFLRELKPLWVLRSELLPVLSVASLCSFLLFPDHGEVAASPGVNSGKHVSPVSYKAQRSR